MALKGHTKIELTNVNTGEIEIYEDDNMVTNALENYFQSLGPFGQYTNLVSSQSLANFTRRFTNGLFLFDKPLEERPDNLLPPSGVQLTGRGSTQVYDGVDKTMGSYSAQSKTLYNGHGVEYVWEFNTSQSNGKIASACLTTSLGAKMGIGTKQSVDGSVTAFNSNFDSSMYISQPYSRVSNYYQLVKVNPDENYCIYMPYMNSYYGNQYYLNSNYGKCDSNTTINQTILNQSFLNTHDVIFYKYRVPFNNLSIFEYNHSPELEKITVHLDELDDIITDAMKTYSWNSWYYNYKAISHHDYIYFYFCYWNGNNGSPSYSDYSIYNTTANSTIGYMWKINTKTFEVEKFFNIQNIVTNNKNGIGVRLGQFRNYDTSNYSTYPFFSFYVTKNEYLLIEATFNNNGSTGYGLCKIDLNNQTDFDWITWSVDADTPANWGENVTLHSFFDCNGKIYFQHGSNHYLYCIDCDDNTYYNVTNEYRSIFMDYDRGHVYCLPYGDFFCFFWQEYVGYPYLFFMPNMLVTINNLPQEIIKSPEQTMKVTYTIVDDNYVTD